MESPTETILQEAQRLVEGPKHADYGHALDNYTDVARIWSVILRTEVTAHQAALCMVGLKIAREAFRAKRDNRVDCAGYAEVADKILEEMERRNAR